MILASRVAPLAWLAACALLAAWIAAEPAGEGTRAIDAATVRYGRDIRPILSDRCFACHGPDGATRRGDVRLDTFEGATALRDGIAPIVPGSPERSELLRRVACEDPDERMPPKDSAKHALDAAQIQALSDWIRAGATYEPHWAFEPPRRPSPPRPAKSAWVATPIDAFILEQLEARGVEPSPPAPAEVQLRRLFLDLTGLPPTPEELDAFLADARPDAWTQWVRKLLHEEPYVSRYAETFATPWLDAARYADTSGIHMDAGRSIWPWRDWVISAFAENLPFDRFVEDQIAGDLLEGATEAQRIASGFNRNHVTTDEGGAIAEEYLVEYAVDRTATTGSVFLGLTLGCARCHEHKFDPIDQEEFYSVYAYFNSIDEPGLYSQEPDAKRALEPFLEVPRAMDLERVAAAQRERDDANAALERSDPEEAKQTEAFVAQLASRELFRWEASAPSSASSDEGATLEILGDRSVRAAGANPDFDTHHIALRTQAVGLRAISIEALGDPGHFEGRVGRAYNGNAVLSELRATAVSIADPSRREVLKLAWAFADHEQPDGDFRAMNAIDADPRSGWAVDGHHREGRRWALFLADREFGFEGGTELRLELDYRSIHAQHVLGRVRVDLARATEAGLAKLPSAAGPWSIVGPFPAGPSDAFDKSFGPERAGALASSAGWEEGKLVWSRRGFLEGVSYNDLPANSGATYLGRRYYAPTKRTQRVRFGSDDGFRLFVDGVEVASRKIDRSLSADAETADLQLEAGEHELVLKIVNTGGIGGFQWRSVPAGDMPDATTDSELDGDLLLALAPPVEPDESASRAARIQRAWRLRFSKDYRARSEAAVAAETRLSEARRSLPRTMVMQERAERRETFVLLRGEYDKPDRTRPVSRGVPAALGALPEGAPDDRRGLAMWLTSSQNPLVARVAVNRIWENLFGSGIVATSEDFGLQGAWPSHPELLDWLAVEFRESGWDVKRLIETIVTSSTYRQASTVRTELARLDPGNRWLAFYPRQRLSAEKIRDGALYVSGLLVEQRGGPSVKPYQPDGLWQEVAMLQSNTRIFERGMGDDLWRRSLYTYWKRACPPPSMLTFDAPTREFCTIRRASTNTPLQALVLWNDEQFVEAARVMAEGVLARDEDDDRRLARMLRACTGRAGDDEQLAKLRDALTHFRARYRDAPQDAAALVSIGARARAVGLDDAELAAWTMIASALLNLDATITKG